MKTTHGLSGGTPSLTGRAGVGLIMGGQIFFQHPIGLWGAEPFKQLSDELGPAGRGIFWDVMEQIRLGRGTDSLDHLLTLYDNVKHHKSRDKCKRMLMTVLTKYNLFNVTQQRMVYAVDHMKDVREQAKKALLGPGLFDVADPEFGIN